MVAAAALALVAALLLPGARGAGVPSGPGAASGLPSGVDRGGRSRRPAQEVDPALAIDLVAAAMLSGVPATTALDVVGAALGGAGGSLLREAAALTAMGADEATAWARADPGWEPLRRALALAATSGAPSAALLRQAALRVRADRASRRRAAAQRLEVLVLLPMGLCALPAFAALGVVPLVVALAAPLVGR